MLVSQDRIFSVSSFLSGVEAKEEEITRSSLEVSATVFCGRNQELAINAGSRSSGRWGIIWRFEGDKTKVAQRGNIRGRSGIVLLPPVLIPINIPDNDEMTRLTVEFYFRTTVAFTAIVHYIHDASLDTLPNTGKIRAAVSLDDFFWWVRQPD